MAGKSPQRMTQQKLAYAQKQVTAKQQALKRLVTSLAMWDRRVKYYSKLAATSDEDLAQQKAAERDRVAQRKAEKVRRGIKLTGGVGG